jgi:hypothetical protein
MEDSFKTVKGLYIILFPRTQIFIIESKKNHNIFSATNQKFVQHKCVLKRLFFSWGKLIT